MSNLAKAHDCGCGAEEGCSHCRGNGLSDAYPWKKRFDEKLKEAVEHERGCDIDDDVALYGVTIV